MAHARELLGAGEAGRTRSHDGHSLAGADGRRLRFDPALGPGAVDDRAFDRLDGHRVVVDVEGARLFAGGWADTAGKFRKVVRGLKDFDRAPPIVTVDQVVPVRDLVVHRAALVTERHAAIHAARALLRDLACGQRFDEFL